MSAKDRIASHQPRKEAIVLPLLPDTSRIDIAQDDHGALVYEAEHGEISSMLSCSIEH